MTYIEVISLVVLITGAIAVLLLVWWSLKLRHAREVHQLELHRMSEGFNYEKALLITKRDAAIEVERAAWAVKNPSDLDSSEPDSPPNIPRQRDSRYDS